MTEVNTAVETTTTVATQEPVAAVEVNAVPEKYAGKSVDDVIKMHQEAEKLIGKKVTELPEDVVKQFLKVPTAPDKYLINEELDQKLASRLKEIGVKNNISQDQMKSIADNLIEASREEKIAREKEVEKFVQENQMKLETKFGKALTERLDGVKDLLKKYGDDAVLEEVKNKGLLHDANFIVLLDRISQDVLKHTLVASDFSKRQLSPAEIDAEIDNLRNHPAYFNKFHAEHASLMKKLNELKA